MDLVVKYNDIVLSPTPLVSQNHAFIDFGGRWGEVVEIELNGTITGISAPVNDIQPNFAKNFAGQFGTLEVLEGTAPIYKWENVVIDEISFPQNHLFLRSMTPYSVKMKSFTVPSGVIEPVNEYSFAQSEDGFVTVNHRASARGVRGKEGGFDRAVNFVSYFRGQDPFSAALAPAFAPSGSGVLISFSESIDRVGCSYGIQEVYKYNTGAFQPYIETWAVNVSDVIDNEWLTVDVDWKLQGSPVQNNLSEVVKYVSPVGPLSKISSLGYDTGKFIQSTSSISRDTGAATVQAKSSYVSGYSLADISGYLDYMVSLSYDEVLPKEDWKIDGDFVCFGPLDYKRARLKAFKDENHLKWREILSGEIVNSPIYKYHNSSNGFGQTSDIIISENTGLAQFKISMSTFDGSRPEYLFYPKYSLEVAPSKWNYDLLPAANIEGHYILQDINMMSKSKFSINISAETNNPSKAIESLSGFLDDISSAYISTGFIISESSNTGLLEASVSREWLGTDIVSSGLLYTKVAGSTLTNFTREDGYMFGY